MMLTLMSTIRAHDLVGGRECGQPSGCVPLTCNRDDFLNLAAENPRHGIVVVRRPTRAAERAVPTCSALERRSC